MSKLTIQEAQQKIKDSICEIMEGGTEAFDMRSRRYKNM